MMRNVHGLFYSVALASALLTAGCGSDNDTTTNPSDTPAAIVGDEVHVSAAGDAAAADGTEKHPYATVATAVAAIEANKKWQGTLIIHEGLYKIMDDVVLPLGVKLTVDAGTTMKFAELKAFHAQADVHMLGTEAKPILLTTLTEGKYWGSFTNYEPTSLDNIFQHVIFEFGVNSNFNDILERGVLALNKAQALITHCIFRDNTGDDGLTLVKSVATVEYSQFLYNISDAIDQGFTGSEIRFNYAEGNGNDAWDLGDGSSAWVHHNVAYDNGDKCISMGEATNGALIEHNLCVHNEVGLAIKDESTPNVRYNTFYDNGVGVWIYPSAPGFGTGKGTFTGNIVWKSRQSDFDVSADFGTQFSYNCATSFATPLGVTIPGPGLIWPGNGCDDPMFADPSNADPNLRDFHLKSTTGRYVGQTGLNLLATPAVTPTWVVDTASSPCIDKGNPAEDAAIVALEPTPNGSIVDLGCYGGSAEASKSP